MIGVWAYLLLAIGTTLFAVAARWLFLRTRWWSLPIGLAMVFLWTLAGAWSFIGDAMSGFQWYRIGLNYHYLMEKMFPFELNGDYVLSLLAYFLFLAGLFVPMIILLKDGTAQRPAPQRTITIDHRRAIFFGVAMIGLSVIMVMPIILQAIADDVSFYLAVNDHSGRFASLRSFADQAAAFSIIFGYATYLVADRPGALFRGKKRGWLDLAFPILLAILGIYTALLGDRQIIFTFFLFSAMYLGVFTGLRGLRKGIAMIVICVGAIFIGGWIRDFSWTEIKTAQRKERTSDKYYHFRLESIQHIPEKKGRIAQIGRFFFTNEMFAAHFSMYGVLHRNVPVEPAISLRYLAASLRPSFIDPERPSTSYEHYAMHARLTPGQGYTIHHASAWYINGGWPGIFFGGCLLGVIWASLIRVSRKSNRWIPDHIPPLLPLLFVAFLPGMLRAGPEAYKMLLVEAFALPILLLTIMRVRDRKTDTSLQPNAKWAESN